MRSRFFSMCCQRARLQVLLRWGLQRGTSQIPKATNVKHLRSNLEVLDFELPKEDFYALNTLGYQARTGLFPACMHAYLSARLHTPSADA